LVTHPAGIIGGNPLARLLRRPSPATVISLIALFVALGGSGYAAVKISGKNIANKSIAGSKLKNRTITGAKLKNRTITGGKLKRNTLTGSEIQESMLGQVPSASKAETATNATNAQTLQGNTPNAFAPASREPVRFVGTVGNPPFEGNWGNPTFAGDEEAGFFKDPYGVVHLYGNARRSAGTDDVIFRLPDGYRPPQFLYFAAFGAGGTLTTVDVGPDGAVEVIGTDTTFVGLGTVSFPLLP
jgi:hypothetical protein